MQPNIRFHDIIGHLLFVILASLAAYFSWERLYVDAGYYLMRVINHETFWVEHNRLILIFAEWLPLLGVYLCLPIKWLVVLYSMGHVVFFYGAYLLSRYTFGNKLAGYQIALVQVLGLAEGFFVPVFELYYGCALAVVYLSMLQSGRKGLQYTIISLLLLAFTLLSHPIMTLLIGFIMIMKALDERKLNWYYLWVALTIVAIFIVKRLTQSPYEAHKMAEFMEGFNRVDYPMDYLIRAANFAFTDYADVIILALAFVTLLAFSRKKMVALVLTVSLFILAYFSNIQARDFNPGRYTEQVYYPVAALLIFTIHLLPFIEWKPRLRQVILISFLIVFSYRITLITQYGRAYKVRMQAIEQLSTRLQDSKHSKFIISESGFNALYQIRINWSLTIESLLYTAAHPQLKNITICTDIDYEDAIREGRQPSDTQYLFRRWEVYEDSTLNNKYFNLANGAYQPQDINRIVD